MILWRVHCYSMHCKQQKANLLTDNKIFRNRVSNKDCVFHYTNGMEEVYEISFVHEIIE